mmetsp:Transcript_27294/g.72098  ORF Transcript_27294/g.72098 Transcript_27294/m.72098 type:complete len:209 (-) Transcript_27294:907-1533(-)
MLVRRPPGRALRVEQRLLERRQRRGMPVANLLAALLVALLLLPLLLLLLLLERDDRGQDVHLPRRDHNAGQQDRQHHLRDSVRKTLDLRRDLRHGRVEGPLPAEADEDTQPQDDRADRVVQLRVVALHVLDLVQDEDQRERPEGHVHGQDNFLDHAVLLGEEHLRQPPVGAEEEAPREDHCGHIPHLGREAVAADGLGVHGPVGVPGL